MPPGPPSAPPATWLFGRRLLGSPPRHDQDPAGLAEAVAGREQRPRRHARRGVGQAVAEVEGRRMSPPAEPPAGLDRRPPVTLLESQDNHFDLAEEPLDQARRHRPITTPILPYCSRLHRGYVMLG